MMLNWARTTNGMMGRSPDFMNVTFAAWGAAADFFGEKKPEFGDNMRRYVEHLRENDICLNDNIRLSQVMSAKSIPHWLDVWGNGTGHDWPWWQQMANKFF